MYMSDVDDGIYLFSYHGFLTFSGNYGKSLKSHLILKFPFIHIFLLDTQMLGLFFNDK